MASDEEIINCLRLINSENVGPVTFYKLLREHKDYTCALEALSSYDGKFSPCPRSRAEMELEKAHSLGIHLITFKDSLYPQNLRRLNDAPPILYVLGKPELLNHPMSVSIVGARNASINGRRTASKIAHDLTENQILVISGMARGIDSAAHKGAMYACGQKGETLAVLGTGVDVPYPRENLDLYHQIADQGAIISEFPLGCEAQSMNFPRRNRIVAGLSSGTLVVEATLNSGSLITARLALEQGRDIFAVPGSPQDNRAFGPNKLIKEGAQLVESAEDILETLSHTHSHQIQEYVDILQKNADIPVEEALTEEPEEKSDPSLLDYLSPEGIYVDELIRISGLSASEIYPLLTELELDGKIERQVGNKVALITEDTEKI